MDQDRIDAIAASEPLTRKLHEPTHRMGHLIQRVGDIVTRCGLPVSGLTGDGLGMSCPVCYRHTASTATLRDSDAYDHSVISTVIETLQQRNYWLLKVLDWQDFSPEVVTRYHDAVTVIDKALGDLRCDRCEVEPISTAILNDARPRCVCWRCAEKENR